MRFIKLTKAELLEFIPLFILKFCVSFNYTILTATKDTVVITAEGGGAEVIPVLKGGLVLLIAFLAMLLYTKLSNILKSEALFYTILATFAGFFLIYGTILFPYKDLLTASTSANWLLAKLGPEHKHWVAIYRNWMHSLFFILTELWGGMMIGMLFWGFANQITSVKNAAKFYALYTAGGQLGTILAGMIIYYYARLTINNFTITIMILMGIVLLGCGVIAGTYWWVNRSLAKRGSSMSQLRQQQVSSFQARTKLSLKDSLVFIFSSPYLGLIAMLVIGYGISVNMVEVSWKAMLKLQFADPAAYQAYMGIMQTTLGVVSLLTAIFLGSKIISSYGWYISASLTPVVLGITTCMFFIVYWLFPDYIYNKFAVINLVIPGINWRWSVTALELLVLCGSLHNICCKTMKYCLFDPTKEMAYIPLDHETKIKGKAAVDLVGSRFGKSGASWTQLALIDLLGAGSILDVLHLLFPCILSILLVWFLAIKNLSRRFAQFQC